MRTTKDRRAMLLEKQAPLFLPQFVAEVAAGYFWDPKQATGSGATFTVPEGNGKTTYNMVTPSAGAAPSATTINGRPAITFANGSPDQILRTATTVSRGFTGAFLIFGWITMPSGAGQIHLGHWRTATNISFQFTAGDVRFFCTDGGGSGHEARFPIPPGGYAAGPFYIEGVFDPSLAATDRMGVAYGRVAQTPTVAASAGTTAQDSAEYLTLGGSFQDSSTLNYSATWSIGLCGITNGIPTSANRDRLYRYGALA